MRVGERGKNGIVEKLKRQTIRKEDNIIQLENREKNEYHGGFGPY